MASTRAIRKSVELDAVLSGSTAPLYEQVYTALRATITQRPQAIGEALPSEGALAKGFGVSRITIRHALHMLEAEGFVRKHKARRSRIAAPPAVTLHKQISSIEDIARGGADRRSVITSLRIESIDEQTREIFALPPRTRLKCLRLQLLWQERLIGHSAIYFQPAYGARLSRADFADVVFIFPVLQRRFGLTITAAAIQVSAVAASAADAACLGCPEGTPLLGQSFVFRNEDNQVVQVNRNRFLGEHYTLSYELGRGGLAPETP